MSVKPSIPKGTRDFSPVQMARRNYIFEVIKKVYRKYGFQQIETPAVENLNTLVGTGGDESDKLIFKILNSGDYLKKADDSKLKTKDSQGLIKSIAEKALHYDLTVPFARYVVQNQNDITFPFRRFQIQPVWRADRPQKGRYREFYQCDADIIGSDSLLNEVDLIKIIDDVFTELFKDQLNYTVSVNNRKILAAIAEVIGQSDKLIDLTVAIDKLDKIGVEKVLDELTVKGFEATALSKIKPLFELGDDFSSNIKFLEGLLSESEIGRKGIEELKFLFETIQQLGLKSANLKLDVTLARGLGYYTGTIIEVKVENFPSITGGGRYDDLTGKFGLKGVSGVGISFGADRIYDVLLDNDLYPNFENESTTVLFTNQDESDQARFLPLLFALRDVNVNAEIYPEIAKWKKQMTFVDRKNIQFIVSSNNEGEMYVKAANTNDKQQFKNAEELINYIQK